MLTKAQANTCQCIPPSHLDRCQQCRSDRCQPHLGLLGLELEDHEHRALLEQACEGTKSKTKKTDWGPASLGLLLNSSQHRDRVTKH